MIPNRENEHLGIIFREKGILNHTKGKLSPKKTQELIKYYFWRVIQVKQSYDSAPNYFFTGGRDGVIKLWKNNYEENVDNV